MKNTGDREKEYPTSFQRGEQVTYRRPEIRMASDFSTATLEAGDNGVMPTKSLKEKYVQPLIPYPTKLKIKFEVRIKIFSEMQ